MKYEIRTRVPIDAIYHADHPASIRAGRPVRRIIRIRFSRPSLARADVTICGRPIIDVPFGNWATHSLGRVRVFTFPVKEGVSAADFYVTNL